MLNFNTLPGGSIENANLGRTLTHVSHKCPLIEIQEAGHWLGLFHTFTDGCSYPNDLVFDTPPQKEASYFCPKYYDKSCLKDDFDEAHLSLFAKHDDADHIIDVAGNFMDYLDDACMHSFTPGQVERIREQWITRESIDEKGEEGVAAHSDKPVPSTPVGYFPFTGSGKPFSWPSNDFSSERRGDIDTEEMYIPSDDESVSDAMEIDH